ncbi:MAG: TonB-dependent receptor plug domain-containing protein, partial [Pseudomonadales bacterium]
MKNLLGLLTMIVLLIGLSSPVRAQALHDFDIPETRLSEALLIFSEQSGVQHLFIRSELGALKVPSVQGRLSAEQALDRLLAGADVRYRFSDVDTVRLFAPDDSPAESSGGDMVSPESSTAVLPTDDDEPDSGALSVMEEIIVSARKREESLQDVPISVSAFSNTFINEAGLSSIFDVADYTPNLSFRESFGRTFDRPVIRGMSNIIGGANAGVFINGIFV